MSTQDVEPEAASAEPEAPIGPKNQELTTARNARVGDLAVRRLFPLRQRRSIGAWCFVDHYGPTSVDGGPGMQVPPHPHIGLQTVTWLVEGEVLHRDSLGNEQLIRPGQLNLMTAGSGIAHSEESVLDHDPRLHGLQLWVALPDSARQKAPAFEHHPDLPRLDIGGLRATVVMGTLAGIASGARTHSELVGADVAAVGDGSNEIPVLPDHEHGVVVTRGSAVIAGTSIQPGQLLYLGLGRDSVGISARAGCRLFLFGGQPLDEALLMWWNFVGRSAEDITRAVEDWRQGRRFGEVPGYAGDPLSAPSLDATRLVARR